MTQRASLSFAIADARYEKTLNKDAVLSIECEQGTISFRCLEETLVVYPKTGALLIGQHHILYEHRIHVGDRLYLNDTPIDVIAIQPHIKKERQRTNIFDDIVTLYGALITTIVHMLV